MIIGELKPGDTYANGKYRVLSNQDGVIQIVRLSDRWRIEFNDLQVNWNHSVIKSLHS